MNPTNQLSPRELSPFSAFMNQKEDHVQPTPKASVNVGRKNFGTTISGTKRIGNHQEENRPRRAQKSPTFETITVIPDSGSFSTTCENFMLASEKGILNEMQKNYNYLLFNQSAGLSDLLDKALLAAAENNHVAIVKYLMETTGANPTCMDHKAIKQAVTQGHILMVTQLMSFSSIEQSEICRQLIYETLCDALIANNLQIFKKHDFSKIMGLLTKNHLSNIMFALATFRKHPDIFHTLFQFFVTNSHEKTGVLHKLYHTTIEFGNEQAGKIIIAEPKLLDALGHQTNGRTKRDILIEYQQNFQADPSISMSLSRIAQNDTPNALKILNQQKEGPPTRCPGLNLCKAAITGNLMVLCFLLDRCKNFPSNSISDALFLAVYCGQYPAVKPLLDKGANEDKTSASATILLALKTIVENNLPETLKRLQSNGLMTNFLEIDHQLLMMTAVFHNIPDTFEVLLENGFRNFEARKNTLVKTFTLASMLGREKIVDLMLNNTEVLSIRYLQGAAKTTKPKIFERVLEKVLISPGSFYDFNKPRFQPLFLEHVENGNSAMVEVMLRDRYQNLIFPDRYSNGPCALKLACSMGRSRVVEMLLADPRVDPHHGNGEALIAAVRSKNLKTVKVILLDGRINPNTPTFRGKNTLSVAISYSSPVIVKALLNDKRIANERANLSQEFFLACKTGKLHFVEPFLKIANANKVLNLHEPRVLKELRKNKMVEFYSLSCLLPLMTHPHNFTPSQIVSINAIWPKIAARKGLTNKQELIKHAQETPGTMQALTKFVNTIDQNPALYSKKFSNVYKFYLETKKIYFGPDFLLTHYLRQDNMRPDVSSPALPEVLISKIYHYAFPGLASAEGLKV